MSVTTGRDLFTKGPQMNDLDVANAPSQTTEQEPALKAHGVEAGRDLFTDNKKGN